MPPRISVMVDSRCNCTPAVRRRPVSTHFKVAPMSLKGLGSISTSDTSIPFSTSRSAVSPPTRPAPSITTGPRGMTFPDNTSLAMYTLTEPSPLMGKRRSREPAETTTPSNSVDTVSSNRAEVRQGMSRSSTTYL